MLDCGMHQGSDAVERIQDENFSFDPATIDAVVLSHAHLDHSGLLPKLCHEGFSGPVICTRATAQLLEIMLNDSVSPIPARSGANQHPQCPTGAAAARSHLYHGRCGSGDQAV
ncbi:MAG: MBL fold metallo-hydrolase [Comamonadaceae bacterium]|nr:MBL fold metallo-hydrolase [Comamonadaceae bacterium]